MHAVKHQKATSGRRSPDLSLFPDYPGNARSFITLDAKLLPYWHLIFDLCPELLRLDPPEGLNLFRQFMVWAYRSQPAQDWTFHISLGRWLMYSDYAGQLDAEQIDSLMAASAARWASEDGSLARGIALVCPAMQLTMLEWKQRGPAQVLDLRALPPARFDFAWSPLSRGGDKGFSRWLRIPE